MMAFCTDTFNLQTVLALLGEDESLCKTGRHVTAQCLVGEISILVVGRCLLSGETVNLFVCLAHHHETSATVAHELRDELKLTLEHESGVDLRVAVA